MGDDSEWMKLPTEEKCTHKVWRARLTGYEEVTKLFRSITDEKSPEFSKYAGMMKKFVTDGNAVAQEKALDAVLVFVENAAVANKTAGEVVSAVIAKCLNASKQKTKEKGIEIIMMYIEIEKPDIVQESLLQGLENKQPKIVVSCVQCLRMALRDFSNKVMPIKPLMKFLPKLLEDRDKNVRDETKLLVVEIHRWIGPALRPMMTNFKPVQVTELEAEFERQPKEKPHQQRFMKSQQDLKAKMEEQAAEGGDGAEDDEEEGEDAVDAYEMMPEVDIIAQLPKDYYDKVEAKKWQERKEALDALEKLANTPRIANGDFGGLVKTLIKVVGKDANVMLVSVGAKCMAGLAKGLRKKYAPYALYTIQVILEKFKEKKPMVVVPLREAADAAYISTTLDAISEEVVAALENKNPSVKAETAYFLGRCFAKSTISTLPKKLLKQFCSCLLKTANDTVHDVRERSYEALGIAMKVVSEKHVAPFLIDVDPIKMQKIQECCQAAVLLNIFGEPRGGAAAAPKPKKEEPKPVQRPSTAPAKTSASSKPAAGKGAPKKKAAKPAAKGKDKKGGAAEGSNEFTENALSDESVEEKATTILSTETVAQLASSNWKERLASMEKLSTTLKGLSKEEIPCQAILRTVCKKPGLKDTNFQVLKIRVEVVGYLAKNCKFSRISAEYCLSDLVDKAGDVKNGAAVQEALSCIAEALSLDFVGREVMKLASEQKNPKNNSECMVWLGNAIKAFGFKINAKLLVALIKKSFGATNPAIRTAAINLVCVMYLYMGQTVRVFFEDEKAALLQQIDAEIEKVKGEKPPAPTRGPVTPAGEEEKDDEDEEGDETEESNVADLIPRNDVGEKFTQELMAEMADKNWKVRKETLEKVAAILNEAKFIKANLGPLPESIKIRLGDSNKVLVNMTIAICLTLANNLGPHCKHHIRVIGPALMGCFGDSKPALRAAAVGALNAWVDQCNLVPLVEVEAILDALRLENPNLRQELLVWLTEKLPNHKQLPPEFKQCVPLLLNCLEDRNGDVRKKAQEALVPFMIHVTYETMFKATSKLKPGSKDTIMALLEKAKASLPAKPQKAKKAAAPVKASSPDSYDESEPSKPGRPLSTASQDSVPDSKPAGKTVRGKAKSAPAPSKKKKEEEDTGPLMNTSVPKEQRFKDEKNQKVLKWNFIEVRGEFIEQLRTQMEKNFSKTMIDLLFHKDFKSHTKAIENLIMCLNSQHDATMVNLDIILKWFTIRFYDTNPSMLNKALEYLRLLFTMLAEEDYHLAEYEAISFIPYLIIKVGDSKDGVRRDVRVLFKLLHKVYPASKTFNYLIDGLKSKNTKQRMECLEELGSLIEAYGIAICQPSPGQALKTITGQIGNRDNGVRNAALNATVVAHTLLGDNLYKYTGALNDKDQDLLDERIKRLLKTRSAQPQKAQEEPRPKTAPQQPQRSASQATIQRPGTAIPKSASSNSVKKFAIEIEDDQTSQPEIPKLIQYDLEEIFQPVKLPPTINRNRPPSPSLRMAKSTDAATTISMVISQITSADITLCIQALAQIDEVLKEEGRAEVMTNHVDQLLLSMSMQLKMVYSTHMGNKATPKDNVIRLYRCLLGTLLALFQNPSLSAKASKDILKDLINNLVTILLDNRLVELDEGAQVVRSVNVMVVKIVEKADHTSIMSALIRLLQDCVASEICSGKFLELIMKCLWKIVRMLPEIINDINLDCILLDIHLFMTAFPGSTWKSRPNDLPIRTIRTILHSISKLQGVAILNHMTMIDGNSEVRSYLSKILKFTGAQNGGVDEEDSRAQRGSAQKQKRLTKSTHDMLAVIFKKIGSKENTKEGLNDLYDFKKKYPDADLEPFLKKSSQFFQMYIERGLNSIEQEREGKQPTSDTGYTKSEIQVIGNPATSESTEEPNVYRQRLRVLRARCGLDNIEEPNNTDPSKPEVEVLSSQDTDIVMVSDDAPTSADPPSSMTSTSSADFSELKMRLERIKRLANS